MTYIKDSIYHTSLPIMVIDDNQGFKKYPQIGYGEEGSIHRYNDKRAFKVFDFFEDREKLKNKFKKIEELARIKDKSFCFPQGLVGYLDLKKEGYFMELVKPMDKCSDFSKLDQLRDMKKRLEYLIMADRAIERIHKKGIIIGDIRDGNIMINKCGEVKFIDTDNYKYGDYDYDLIPTRSKKFEHTYGKEINGIDNDKFVFTMMALQYFIPGPIFWKHNEVDYYKEMVELLEVSEEVKEGLRLILSDAPDKPYVGKVLKKINPEEMIILPQNVKKLERKY